MDLYLVITDGDYNWTGVVEKKPDSYSKKLREFHYRSGYIDCYWSLSDFELSFMAIEDYRDKVINELL